MECGFKSWIECNEEYEFYATCTRNPLNQKKKMEVIKDRECVSCTKLFDCKGKPRGVTCVNYEERKRDGRR